MTNAAATAKSEPVNPQRYRSRLGLSEQTAKREEKANRSNPEFKNRRNRQQTNGIPKVNRDKNARSALLFFRLTTALSNHNPGGAACGNR
jgi:hypothetical protein